ncbi:unnamed protein product [Dicrocoelium dendriticum]|nr:unnamed protein product [Dicrocoelium dendriticum]
MDWKNTFEKAGSLSKLAFTALKNAQQKIDAVLDIELNSDITPPASLLAESKHLEEPRRTFDGLDVTHSSFVNNDAFFPDDDTRMQLDPISPNTKDCADRSASKSDFLLTETPLRIPTTHPALRPDVISLSATSIPTSPKGIPVSSSSPSIETVSTVTLESTHLDRSCSETDLTCLKTCTLGNIAHHKTPRTDAELDLETTTTGSDIEVMSCGNSTNGDSLHLSHQLSHQQSPLTHAKEVGDFGSSFGPHACTKYFSNSLAGRHALSPVSEM